MNFKNKLTPYIAILGVAGSVLGINSLLVQNETPVSLDDNSSTTKETNVACSKTPDTFAQDETQVLASEYSKDTAAECLFVGCGGVI